MARQTTSQTTNQAARQDIDQAERNKENIQLARDAAADLAPARKKVNGLIEPIIQYQTNRFCKRFCKENRYHFKCTLRPPLGSPPADASLCEWGNGSYAWMLNDLSNANRLNRFQANNNATLFDYCYVIANSLPFYERWKDWRFGRKVHVPSYIQALGTTAKTVFYGLRSQQSIEQISQQASRPVEEIIEFSRSITKLLAQKNRLHLLNPSHNVSLSNDDDGDRAQSALDSEIASYDEPLEELEENRLLSETWKKLDSVEQFVLEALVIEEQDAEVVLSSLKKLDISFKKGSAAKDLDRQQLYYFRRKTLAKLHELMEAAR